jgi:hypothetical protein
LRQLSLHPSEIDLKTVLEFFKSISDPSIDEAPSFLSIYLENKERVSNLYKQRFLRYLDLEKFNAEKDNLEPGFNRICGLKGSKLSGG